MLWRHEDGKNVVGHFRVRIILVNTGPLADQEMQMPWSEQFVRKMDAKKDAARVCLEYLLENHLYPHDPSRLPLAVASIATGCGGGSASASGPERILPELAPHNPFGLLAVEPVIMTPIATGSSVEYTDDGSDQDDDDDELEVCRMATFDVPSSPMSAAPQSLPPANLGTLGEKYALEWLAVQSWVMPGSVRWENKSSKAATRDIACQPKGPPGRTHIEVKTRWRRFKKAGASRAQRARLLDPEDDYMLLIVGYFENLYPSDGSAPRPPQIRILPNSKWEDKTVTCVWCNNRFEWSVAEQQASGSERPNTERCPELCVQCLGKIKRNAGKLRTCASCHKPWVFEDGERRYMEKKGFSDPKRCKPCRAQARGARGKDERH